jgi:hypothetical protein
VLLSLSLHSLVAVGDVLALCSCRAISTGPQDFIAARGAVGEPFATAVPASLGSSSSSEFDASRRREIGDLIREVSEVGGRYSDATREVGRLEADLAAMHKCCWAAGVRAMLERAPRNR